MAIVGLAAKFKGKLGAGKGTNATGKAKPGTQWLKPGCCSSIIIIIIVVIIVITITSNRDYNLPMMILVGTELSAVHLRRKTTMRKTK